MPRKLSVLDRLDATSTKAKQAVADKLCVNSTNVAREAALAFLEADANGDGVLDFDEFINAIKKLRSPSGNASAIIFTPPEEEEIQHMFDSIECVLSPNAPSASLILVLRATQPSTSSSLGPQ